MAWMDAEIARLEALEQARVTGQSTTVLTPEGAPPATMPTSTEPGATIPEAAGGGRFSAPPIQRGDVQAQIPDTARDPQQLEIERLEAAEAEAAETVRRGPAEGKLPGFMGDPTFLERELFRAGSTAAATIADAVGSTAEEVSTALEDLGIKIFNRPENSKKEVHNFLNKLGVSTRRYEGIAARLGGASAEAMIMTAAWYKAAPALAARAPGMWQSIGQAIQKNPGLILAQELGATAGARYGEEQLGITGSVLGAVIGGSGAQLGRALLRPVARITGLEEGAVRRAMTGKDSRGLPKPGSEPIREPVDPQTASIVARQDIAASQRLIETRVQTVLDNAANASLRSPEMAASRFHKSAEEALETARGIEKTLWNATATARQAQTSVAPILDVFNTLRAETGPGKIGVLPNSFMRYLERKFMTPAVPAQKTGILGPNGQPLIIPEQPAAPKDISVGDMLDFHSSILKRIARERKAPVRGREINRELIQNYVAIDHALLDLVQKTVPGDRTIEAARAFSRFLNDSFTRGPMGAILGHVGRNEAVTPPGLAIQRLLKDYEGTRQLSAIRTVGQTGSVPQFSAAVAEAEQGIRSTFREAMESATPEVAARYMQKIEPSVRPLARLNVELTTATDELVRLHQLSDTIAKSSLSRFMEVDSAVAIRRLLADPKGPTTAREIMREIGHDPKAVSGIKAGVVDELMRTTEGSPNAIKKLMAEPKMDRTLNEIFTSAERARFDRLIEIGARVENGDEKLLRKFFRGGVPIIARIIGAQGGRTLARFGGGGTVQTPGIVAGVTKNWFTDALKGISLPELMARAVLDPKWEKVLLMRTPENPKDVRRAIKWIIKPLINAQASTISAVEGRLRDRGRKAEAEGQLRYPTEGEP